MEDLIVQRLIQAGIEGIRVVEEALSSDRPLAYPALLVIPLRETSAPNTLIGAHDQQDTILFAVDIFLRIDQQKTHPGGSELRRVKAAVRDAVVGWSPSEEYDPIDHVRGQLVAIKDNECIWRQEFQTRRNVRMVP